MAARVIKLGKHTWTLGRRLGGGGFGTVYAARNEVGDEAALKLIPKFPGAERELQIAADLAGVPNVMPVIEVGETGRELVIVMPMAERSLDDELTIRNGPIPSDEAISILADIANGLAGSHARGILSRDVKPSNALLLNGAWYVSDLGIGRYADRDTSTYTFKDARTEEYTAPERWRGERAGPPADIYAFGVTAFEVLTGVLPFKGPDFGAQHARMAPPPLAGVPPRLASIVAESLDKLPDVRPPAANIVSRLRALATPSTPGAAALHTANQAVAEANSKASAERATAQAFADRTKQGFEAAAARFRPIEAALQEALDEASQVSTATKRTTTTGWSRQLGPATISVEAVQSAAAGNWGHSPPAFEVFAFTKISIVVPRDRYDFEGRSHSLWFCDAREPGVFRWYETAFMDSPFSQGRPPVEPYALPPRQDAGVALAPVMGTQQVAWPFLPIDQGDEGDWIERWLTWFGQAAMGRLGRPSSMPERSDAHNSWRR